jgi:2-polyprenyl-3-methyl-5-hydroxy-6-metoxy-1,4-benzoquinol methylase
MIPIFANATAPSIADTPWPQADLQRLGHCPVCQSTSRALRYADVTDRLFGCAPGHWQIYTCIECQTAYVDSRPTEGSIGRAYGTYFTHNDGKAVSVSSGLRGGVKAALNGFRKNHWQMPLNPANTVTGKFIGLIYPVRELVVAHMRNLPRQLPRPGACLLDVGCGNGLYLELARQAGWQVKGVDFDTQAVASAQTRGLDVRVGGLEQVQDLAGSFDRLTCSHVIEHVHEPRKWLQSMHAMLRPGGSLWLQTPNVDALGHKRFGADWLGLDPPRHLTLMNPRTLRNLLEESGFSVRMLALPALMALSVYQDSDCMAKGLPQIGTRLSWRSFVQWSWLKDAWHQSNDLSYAEFITVEAVKV